MGKDIKFTPSKKEEVEEFKKRVEKETAQLQQIFKEGSFVKKGHKVGIELEGWLLNENMLPDPFNETFLKAVDQEQIVPEIAKFNFEINSSPFVLASNGFSKLENEMLSLWNECTKAANSFNKNAILIGTLPTLRPHMLSLDYLSASSRYKVMNQKVMELRNKKPLNLRMDGKDSLRMSMDSVIAECAATSLQIHLGVDPENAKDYYNASTVASAFLIAVSANSPYFFGKELWDESRIGTFEQAVEIEAKSSNDGLVRKRVSLGSGFVKKCLFELFEENIKEYPILLSELSDEDFFHLRLHNGTIWRWTRPVLGDSGDGKYHLRIEQRTPSSGPTIVDSIANSMFYIGMVDYLANLEDKVESQISFYDVVQNFYAASRISYFAKVTWIDGKSYPITKLLKETIFPEAKKSLIKRGLDKNEVDYYMDSIILERINKEVNGAIWQKAFIHTHGKRFQELLEAYYENQKTNTPVHKWKI